MIPVPSGVRVWLATGVTDMRRGMNGLTLQVQEAMGRDPYAGDLFVFGGGAATLSRCSGMTDWGARFMPSGWSAAASSGPHRRTAWSRFLRPSSAICSKGSIGGTPFTAGGPLVRGDVRKVRRPRKKSVTQIGDL